METIIKIQAKTLDHIFYDSDGNILIISDDNKFTVNGQTVWQGDYISYDFNNGILAVEVEEMGKRRIYLNDQEVYNGENISLSWRLLFGKLVLVKDGYLSCGDEFILDFNRFEDYTVVADRLFVQKGEFCYEVNLITRKLTPIRTEKIANIHDDGKRNILFVDKNNFIADGEVIFQAEADARIKKYVWNNGILGVEIENSDKRIIYLDSKVVHQLSQEDSFFDWDVLNGKMLILDRRNISYGGKRLFTRGDILDYKVVNNHLFVCSKSGSYYELILP